MDTFPSLFIILYLSEFAIRTNQPVQKAGIIIHKLGYYKNRHILPCGLEKQRSFQEGKYIIQRARALHCLVPKFTYIPIFVLYEVHLSWFCYTFKTIKQHKVQEYLNLWICSSQNKLQYYGFLKIHFTIHMYALQPSSSIQIQEFKRKKREEHNKLLKSQIRCVLKKSGKGIGSTLWILQKQFPALKVSPCVFQ